MAQSFEAGRLELSGEPLPIAEQVASDAIFGDGMFSVSENHVLAYRGGRESLHQNSAGIWSSRTSAVIWDAFFATVELSALLPARSRAIGVARDGKN